MKVASAILAVSAMLTVQAFADQNESDAGEIVEITRVPIESIYRVERMDGNVFWVSGDRRWAFHGELRDMWTGRLEQDMKRHQAMSWERTGMRPQSVAVDRDAERYKKGVLFIDKADAMGPEMERVIHSAERQVALAPIAFVDDWDEWGWIWCQFENDPEAIEKWLRNTRIQRKCQDQRAGAAMAFAQIFNMADKTPVAIDREGAIYYGEEEVLKWLEMH